MTTGSFEPTLAEIEQMIDNDKAQLAALSEETPLELAMRIANNNPDVYGLQDYGNHPKSIKEHKAKLGSEWTPRDALISALRDIDSGAVKMDHVIIIGGRLDEDANTATTFYNATPNRYYLHGLIGDFTRRLTNKDVTGDF